MKEKKADITFNFYTIHFLWREKKNTATGCDFFNIVSINQDKYIFRESAWNNDKIILTQEKKKGNRKERITLDWDIRP